MHHGAHLNMYVRILSTKDIEAAHRMRPNGGVLRIRQAGRLPDNFLRDHQLSDIVKQAAERQRVELPLCKMQPAPEYV